MHHRNASLAQIIVDNKINEQKCHKSWDAKKGHILTHGDLLFTEKVGKK
jgi:hypothetical protein